MVAFSNCSAGSYNQCSPEDLGKCQICPNNVFNENLTKLLGAFNELSFVVIFHYVAIFCGYYLINIK